LSGPLAVAILGATGSVGQQALEVIDRYPDRFRLFAVVSGRRPCPREARFSVVASDPDYEERLAEIVTHPDCDLVLVAIPGAQALAPTLAALEAGKTVAIASKEVLVMAGELVMAAAGTDRLRAVDSEHSAIWQCIWGEAPENVSRLVLTASGGPFWGTADVDLDAVTVEQALQHPRWSMGPKVTVDSATLMNKALEVIEAHHLFRLPLDRIDVLIHPQSVVHSLVEFRDGSAKAQLGNPDMRLPIALALSYPERLPDVVAPTRWAVLEPLTFHELDETRFPAVRLARRAAAAGAPLPAVFNGANAEAVNAFLAGGLGFSRIVPEVEAALGAFGGGGSSLEAIREADLWARSFIRHRAGLKAPS
jgi:1-deoxy-D-xylulose-5-phosphate reductoisomerase